MFVFSISVFCCFFPPSYICINHIRCLLNGRNVDSLLGVTSLQWIDRRICEVRLGIFIFHVITDCSPLVWHICTSNLTNSLKSYFELSYGMGENNSVDKTSLASKFVFSVIKFYCGSTQEVKKKVCFKSSCTFSGRSLDKLKNVC